MPNQAKKVSFIKRTYFAVTDNPQDDVNPYTDLDNFGNGSVGSLRWGQNEPTKQRSKLRFSYNYHNVLKYYGIVLEIEDIFQELSDNKKNDEVVNSWVQVAKFK